MPVAVEFTATTNMDINGEYPIYQVCVVDKDGCEIGKVYESRNYSMMEKLARKIAIDRKLELINDVTPY